MLHASKVRSLTRSIVGLFVTKKTNITFLNHKELYYKHYWFPKNLCDGVDLVAAIERTSKKMAAQMLMERGFSSYMGDKVKQEIERQRSRRENNQIKSPSRFAILLRKMARERGIDISKFI